MTTCNFCGRENDVDSRFCIDCGKPIDAQGARVGPAYATSASGGHAHPVLPPASGARPPFPVRPSAVPPTRVSEPVALCTRCGKPTTPGLPFCAHCGAKVAASAETADCAQCGAPYTKGVDIFCARCGNRVGQRVSIATPGVEAPATEKSAPAAATQVFGANRLASTTRISLLGDAAQVVQTYNLERGEAVVGRGDADIRFENDHFMSPLHVRLEVRDGQLSIRDLGSRNSTWVFIDKPTKLSDCDLMLMGSQVIRFRRLGYPGPHPPDADSTRRMGSAVPNVDIAVLEQLRADGSVRDTLHLSPGRSITLGRESGDWVFPYDATMSGRHTEIRSEDNEFYVHDANSRNGVAMATRGERTINKGQRMLIGDQILRVESV